MRIALYTPSIPRDHALPSGAATATEALAGAFEIAGHATVSPAEPGNAGGGPGDRMAGTACLTEQDVGPVIARLSVADRRPDTWVTYGLRDDAPDHVGPHVAHELRIPYVLIDPRGTESKTSDRAVRQAVETADAIVALSDASVHWASGLRPDGPLTRLLPFLDPAPYDSVRRVHGHQAASIAMRLGLKAGGPRLLCVSAMRPGRHLDSFRMLARALSRLAIIDWQLIVLGDGPARHEVEAMLRRLPLGRVHLVGALPPEEVIPYYAMSTLLVAPSVGGTHGRALLEAQATGLPVVAGDTPGVRDVVRDGMTGRLCPADNAEALAQTIAFLLRQSNFLSSLAIATTQAISRDHHIASAAAQLDAILTGLTVD